MTSLFLQLATAKKNHPQNDKFKSKLILQINTVCGVNETSSQEYQ